MSEDLKILEDIVDFLNGLEACCIKLRTQIEKLLGHAYWDPGKIKWTEEEGTKGPYEKSEDVNSLDFKGLVKDLNAHKGALNKDGYFYWLFENGATVGRKKRKA